MFGQLDAVGGDHRAAPAAGSGGLDTASRGEEVFGCASCTVINMDRWGIRATTEDSTGTGAVHYVVRSVGGGPIRVLSTWS